MRICLVFAFAAALHGATIRGTVVENLTGHFLARAVIAIEPVAGSAGPHTSVRSSATGIFEFTGLPAGTYLVSASRRAFAPVQYGQKHWRAAGVPVVISADDTATLAIRLPRLGSITGTLFDENDVGLPDHEVAIYVDSRPPVLITRARTDDRGMYRFYGLSPGSYLVRTLTKADEEGAFLPTFFKNVAYVDQAISVEVTLDQQVDGIDIHPPLGKTYIVAGRAINPNRDPVVVTMVSDMGTEFADVDAQGNFHFNPAAPGQYELMASTTTARYSTAAYMPLSLDRDQQSLTISMASLPQIQFVIEDTKGVPLDGRQLTVLMRHKDLSGTGKTDSMHAAATARLPIQPGRYDVTLNPGAGWYVASFSGPLSDSLNQGRADGWNEINVPPNSLNTLKFVLSASPATLHGVVRGPGGQPVAGIPVFLEPFDLERHKRVKDFVVQLTDINGQYRFTGLAPGSYRLISTFEYRVPDARLMDLSVVKSVRVEEAHDENADLDQYIIR
jgi:Carboxypeptidase regulatory-like domain